MDIPIQIINNTGTINMNQPDINWIILTAPIVAGIIGFFTIWYSKKQHNRNAIIDVFGILNNVDHKKAEHEIIFYFKANTLYDGGKISFHYENSASIVCRNYDQLGLLVERELVPRKDVFYMFGKIIIISHWVLFQEIKCRRLLGESDYMVNFTRLAIDCYNYWNEKGNNRLPREPQGNMEIKEGAIEQWKESLPK